MSLQQKLSRKGSTLLEILSLIQELDGVISLLGTGSFFKLTNVGTSDFDDVFVQEANEEDAARKGQQHTAHIEQDSV